jgi:hypothetical protein
MIPPSSWSKTSALRRVSTATIDMLRAYMVHTGVPHRVTSTLRPSDEGSWHSAGLAVDFAGPTPGKLTPALDAIYMALLPLAPRCLELIYGAYGWKNGNPTRYSATVQLAHRDHVHIAMPGGWSWAPPPPKETPVADDPNIPNMEGPIHYHIYTDPLTGVCIGYHVYSERTGELHGHGPAAVYHGRSEDPTPG